MSTDTGRSNLNKNHGAISSNWFGTDDPFLPRNWVKCINYIPEEFYITPSSSANAYSYDSETTIEIDKRGDALGAIELIWERNKCAGGVNQRFVDWEAPFSIDNITFEYGNRIFYKIFGDKLYLDTLKANDHDLSCKAKLQHGFLDAATRTALNDNANVTKVRNCLDLRVPWAKLKKMIVMNALPNKIIMRIHWNQLKRCTEADSGHDVSAGCSITNVRARCQYYHFEQDKKDASYNRVYQNNGIATKFSTVEFHRRETIQTGAIGWTLKLRNIKNDVYLLIVALRKKADVEGTNVETGANPTEFKFPVNYKVQLQDNGTDIIKPIDLSDTVARPSYHLWGVNSKVYPSSDFLLGFPVVYIPLSETAFADHGEDDCLGSRNLASYNNPELVLTFDALDADYTCDVYGMIHNILYQQRGDIRVFIG
jgi:hypothetical protein